MSNGMGDQLERYVFCAHNSLLLGIDPSNMLVRGFQTGPGVPAA
jgi:hypothetical protein